MNRPSTSRNKGSAAPHLSDSNICSTRIAGKLRWMNENSRGWIVSDKQPLAMTAAAATCAGRDLVECVTPLRMLRTMIGV